jgi:hypothetical protein
MVGKAGGQNPEALAREVAEGEDIGRVLMRSAQM